MQPTNYWYNPFMADFSYHQITTALSRLDIPAEAAECHGALSAVVCLAGQGGAEPWINAHFPEIEEAVAQGDALAQETKQLLQDFYQHVFAQLGSGDFSYQLMMPDENSQLEERTQALSHWCQGFLLGIRYAGVTDINKFSGELAEILQDITEISQVSGSGLENNEEEERSYTELMEYLKVGVMLFFETLQHGHQTGQATTVH
jgi:uncharacterized protein YgfB (UPF0149 family)